MRTALASLLLLVSVSAARAQDATPAPAGPVEIPAPRAAADSASELPAAVAEERITVSSDYRGSYITVFGVNPDRRGRGDIVVVVRGPGQTATLMRKTRVFGLWINGAPVRFSSAPSFFAVLSNRPLRQIASPESIWRYGLDPAAAAQLETATPRGADPSDYKAALVRLRREQDLYQVYASRADPNERGGLTMYQGGLFRAVVLLPANAPIARYQADTYLFREGRLISSQTIPIDVSRVGIERRIHDLATQASFVYGLLTVLLALFAGWIASILFRRA
ncbi:MAG TPA: TIGR02186 family protein [Vitreimonas sp.]|nr:TIGR02186 family protein [Vitreimonas sp.]